MGLHGSDLPRPRPRQRRAAGAASAGSSGLALLGAAAFGDAPYLGALLTSLDFAAFPVREGDRLRYAASNQVGDAALLYALSFGPLWERIAAAGGAP
ncbi:hypothetical protein WME91_49300 [Sorangium sp. So ce269]